MPNLPAPRSNTELRAPKTAGIHGRRDAPAARPHGTPYARLVMGEKGGVQSGAALPYLLTEVSPKAAHAASILATEAQAPSPRIASLREQKGKPADPAMSPIQTNSNNCEDMQKILQKEFKKNSIPS